VSPDPTLQQIEEAIGPLDRFAHQCHAASIALVRSRLLGESRVARGTCRGVGGQHSWVVVGNDCYADGATIVDLTAWSYGLAVPKVWVTRMGVSPHRPHGWSDAGLIEYGCPMGGGGPEIALTPEKPLSREAENWLGMFRSMVGTLDRVFWLNLGTVPTVKGWPAGEFYAAMDDTPQLAALVPVDRLGMLTDRNPGALYLPA
jgi:hypothetical protein